MKFLRFKTIKSKSEFCINVNQISHFHPKTLNDGVTYTSITLINIKEDYLVSETFDEVFNLVNSDYIIDKPL